MPINPWPIGQTSPSWSETLLTDSGTANLTGIAAASVSMIFTNTTNGASITRTNGDGSGCAITISQSNPGIITYQPLASDVVKQVMYRVRAQVTFSNGPGLFDLGIWDIVP